MSGHSERILDESSSTMGRIEEALRILGMNGPLDVAEDALDALDSLVAERDGLREQLRWLNRRLNNA